MIPRKTLQTRRTASNLALAARILTTRLAERLRPLGLAPAQYLVLQELWTASPLTQSELAARVGVEQATMAATLKRMERDGLITRHPHPTDERARMIRTTPRADALAGPAVAEAVELDRTAMAVLGAGELAELRGTLVRLLESYQGAALDPEGD